MCAVIKHWGLGSIYLGREFYKSQSDLKSGRGLYLVSNLSQILGQLESYSSAKCLIDNEIRCLDKDDGCASVAMGKRVFACLSATHLN
jgi:hypothetical protein